MGPNVFLIKVYYDDQMCITVLIGRCYAETIETDSRTWVRWLEVCVDLLNVSPEGISKNLTLGSLFYLHFNPPVWYLMPGEAFIQT